MHKHNGFTLVEISIVLVIIGLILGGVIYGGQALIFNTKTTGTVSLIKDVSGATYAFKGRYHYLPGDLPRAGEDIANVSAACNVAGNGNGLIDTPQEVSCASEELVLSGLLKGSPAGIVSPFGVAPDVTIIAAKNSAVFGSTPFPPTVPNVIQIGPGFPFEAAEAIDSKLDDGNPATGNIMAFPLPNASGVAPATTTVDVAL